MISTPPVFVSTSLSHFSPLLRLCGRSSLCLPLLRRPTQRKLITFVAAFREIDGLLRRDIRRALSEIPACKSNFIFNGATRANSDQRAGLTAQDFDEFAAARIYRKRDVLSRFRALPTCALAPVDAHRLCVERAAAVLGEAAKLAQPARVNVRGVHQVAPGRSFVRRVEAEGIRDVGDDQDEHQMLPGDDIYEGVDRGIRLWDKVLLCASKDSLKSWWVDNEIDTALAFTNGVAIHVIRRRLPRAGAFRCKSRSYEIT